MCAIVARFVHGRGRGAAEARARSASHKGLQAILDASQRPGLGAHDRRQREVLLIQLAGGHGGTAGRSS